jgi:Sulfatase
MASASMHIANRFPIAMMAVLWLAATFAHAAPARPNVVFILSDNQGAWTLGCYGNPDIRTPNIDRLAAEGIRFTRALSSNPVCSPARATFLTGLIPSQHGVHSFLEPKLMMGPQAYDTLKEMTCASFPDPHAATSVTYEISLS